MALILAFPILWDLALLTAFNNTLKPGITFPVGLVVTVGLPLALIYLLARKNKRLGRAVNEKGMVVVWGGMAMLTPLVILGIYNVCGLLLPHY